MLQRKFNIALWCSLGLTVLLLAISMVLSVGTVWGRYRSELDPFTAAFTHRKLPQVYLWGEKSGEEYEPLSNAWSVETGGSAMPFLVTNGTKDSYAAEDLNITIRVAATAGVSDGEDITINLLVDDESGNSYVATATAIRSGTKLYDDFGDGWIYQFYDEEGKELTWKLEGGKLAEFAAQLMCEGVIDQPDATLLQIQVTAAAVQ